MTGPTSVRPGCGPGVLIWPDQKELVATLKAANVTATFFMCVQSALGLLTWAGTATTSVVEGAARLTHSVRLHLRPRRADPGYLQGRPRDGESRMGAPRLDQALQRAAEEQHVRRRLDPRTLTRRSQKVDVALNKILGVKAALWVRLCLWFVDS